MHDAQWIGLAGVVMAGIFQGSFMLPMKWTRRWAWENTWLIFSFTAYLLLPWTIVLSTMPCIFGVYHSIGAHTLLMVILFGAGWGVGAVTFGVGVDAVGLALGFAVILGVAACAGTLLPLLLLPAGIFSEARIVVTAASLVLMLLGVALCSYAGLWKEQRPITRAQVPYRKGLVVCFASGILSACGNLGFVYGADIADKAHLAGAPADLAPNAIWALLTLALFVCNGGYALLRLRRNHTARNFNQSGTAMYYLLGILMGALWMGGFVLYGAGARRLGPFGSSLGWAMFMSVMVIAANLLGIATGEWRGAPASAGRLLAVGLLVLVLASVGLGYANQLGMYPD